MVLANSSVLEVMVLGRERNWEGTGPESADALVR